MSRPQQLWITSAPHRSSGIAWIVITFTVVLAVVSSATLDAQTYEVIHNFSGATDGAGPTGPLTLDAVTGFLYGTTYGRQYSLYGTVYVIKQPDGAAPLTTLFKFSEGTEGAYPWGVVLGPDRALYGFAHGGGLQTCGGDSGNKGCGVAFRLIPPLKPCAALVCFWTETPSYMFMPGGQDANNPVGVPIFDQSGALYGTSEFGGGVNCNGGAGCGTVFKLVRSGNTFNESILYSFTNDGINGYRTYAGVVFDTSGNLFGTNFYGPPTGCPQFYAGGCGTVYQLTPSGNTWTDNTLYAFQSGTDGRFPVAGVLFDTSGNLFGATVDGGDGGGGTVFELEPSGNSWIFKELFGLSGLLGSDCGPQDNLTIDTATGDLYGTTFCDGANHYGNVFKLANTQNGWVYHSLYDFVGGTDGANPSGGVVLEKKNGIITHIYGTALAGGMNGKGVVFRITP